MKIFEAKRFAVEKLKNLSSSAFLDADILLQQALNMDRAFLFAHPEAELTRTQQQIFFSLLQRRQQGEPMAYIRGVQEFYGLNFFVDQNVLIPRPETELLVDVVLGKLPAQDHLKVLDLGCGSGAIAITLAWQRKNWQITAVDQSTQALNLAKRNAAQHQLQTIHFAESNWFAALEHQTFDCIVSNPPYLSADDVHLKDLSFEPKAALIAVQGGMAAFFEIISQARKHLNSNGYIFFEHGLSQHLAIAKALQVAGFSAPTGYPDLAGHLRVICAQVARYTTKSR